MIILLGASGFVGSRFSRHLAVRDLPHVAVSRRQINYTHRDSLLELLRDAKATFVINCGGFVGKPNVDACETNKAECYAGNVRLPLTIQEACGEISIPWGHVSSGCIYSGSKSEGRGYTEEDAPNFSFAQGNCSYYSGCKALAEEKLDADRAYIWRLRMPFDHVDSDRNYLSKLMRYERLLDVRNSLSHIDDFVAACFDCWQRRVPLGIYNVTNGGSVTTREVTRLINRFTITSRTFKFFANETEFMACAAVAPRSSCVLDNSKLMATGIRVPHVHDALERSLKDWRADVSVAGGYRRAA